MRTILGLAGAMTLAGAATLSAQEVHPQCAAADINVQDACQKTVDVYRYMAPQLGTVIAGGNATLGQGGTLGGLGHFVVEVRANTIMGSLPETQDVTPSITGPQQTTFTTKDQLLALPSVDAAVGVFKGLPVGLTSVGGVDLLVSASYLPEYSGAGVGVVVPDGSFKFGYGARLGLLQESLAIPGVSVTYFRRDLPTVDLSASVAEGGTTGRLYVDGFENRTSAWRLVASKNLMVIGLALGVGQDTYESSAQIRATSSGFTAGPFELEQTVKRTNYFADLYWNVLLAKVVAEVGMVQGGEIRTYNQFDGKAADDARLYGSLGIRIGM